MSEYINNTEKRLESLLQLSLGLMSGEKGKELIEIHREAIDNMTPHDMVNLEDIQIKMGISTKEIKKYIDKIINVFYTSLKNYNWKKPENGTFLSFLMLENKAYEFRLKKVKIILKSYNSRDDAGKSEIKAELLEHFKEFLQFESHYVKKENILFPVLEQVWENYRPLKVMWSLHDDIRKKLKSILNLLESDSSTWPELAKEIGAFYFLVFGMIQKEDLVVYPIAFETLSESEWAEMHLQSFEYPFPFIEKPQKPEIKSYRESNEIFFQSESGGMDFQQIELMMNSLPLDATLVDEKNKVVYFSSPKDRFFPRSPAIIGRDVKNCHPPESVHIVEEIIRAFKTGEKKEAKFWIQMNGKFIVITYYALWDKEGTYKGVLETSQDISELRKIKGEKRLLDWE